MANGARASATSEPFAARSASRSSRSAASRRSRLHHRSVRQTLPLAAAGFASNPALLLVLGRTLEPRLTTAAFLLRPGVDLLLRWEAAPILETRRDPDAGSGAPTHAFPARSVRRARPVGACVRAPPTARRRPGTDRGATRRSPTPHGAGSAAPSRLARPRLDRRATPRDVCARDWPTRRSPRASAEAARNADLSADRSTSSHLGSRRRLRSTTIIVTSARA